MATHHAFSTDVIPGTVHLVDLAGTLRVKHEEGGDQAIVLLPQPTTEYDDPLNWSRRRKLLSAIMGLVAVFSGDVMTTLLSAALLDIESDTGIPLATLNSGVGVQYLFFGEWYANRVLIGFFYGPIETLVEICISDVFFAHDRGFWIGMYCWILFGIPFLGAVPAGSIAQNLGWQWIQFIASIISAGCVLAMFFLMEETMFFRPPVQDEVVDVEEDVSDHENASSDSSPQEKKVAVAPTETEVGVVVTKKTYMQKLKFWGARRPGQPNNFFRSVWLPSYMLRYPVVTFSGVLVGSVLSWFNVVNATIALVLAAPPYNFSTNGIGLIFLAPFIGCTIGCIFAGASANRFAVWMSKRKGGIFEPEYRLWMALWEPNTGVHWVGLAFGLAFIVGTFPIGSAIAINHIIDSYREISGDGLVTMICIRNAMGFGFSYGVTPWIEATGVQNTYIAVGFIGMFFWGLSFLFIVIGKKLRKRNAKNYWGMVEKHGLSAH
ncbi:hypothetical protein G647_07849 [Cladophialophora carrionii CBS 160.54]|uniref:Major facilitator superfamily (MFS) profile domain-containing protein n=1 Tax=Cladophialophora carrionii CBS 160.54 TaxID=1279043 RepID=V9D693_9EURO|nr:uncharacterized protein G647_07849 [Cladophialophora carrionii CBS 160.54]ETI21502.1 hypothetical protein G647_07849 [Cladophialophora carrionii CBS 160.54]